MFPLGTATYDAWIHVRDVPTARAVLNAVLDADEGLGHLHDFLARSLEHIQGQPLGGLRTNAGKLCEFFY